MFCQRPLKSTGIQPQCVHKYVHKCGRRRFRVVCGRHSVKRTASSTEPNVQELELWRFLKWPHARPRQRVRRIRLPTTMDFHYLSLTRAASLGTSVTTGRADRKSVV